MTPSWASDGRPACACGPRVGLAELREMLTCLAGRAPEAFDELAASVTGGRPAEAGEPARRGRFRCTLAPAGETCEAYARVTVADSAGDEARCCARHAVSSLESIPGARVVWIDTKGLNEHELTAIRMTEERISLVRR